MVNEQVKSGKISFINPRDGWIFIALETKTAAPELLLDGRKMTLRKHGTRLETMRHLSAGKHAATVSKAEPSDKVIVRTVPVLFCYPALRRNIMPQEGTYDWDFTEKYILPACNTFNFYGLPGGEKDRLKLQERGVELLGSRTFRVGKPFEGRDAFVKYISKPVKNLEGYTLDEVAFVDWPGMIQPVVESLWSLSAAESRTSFNLWVGFPSKFGIFPVLHQDLLAALGNSFSGNSRILYETYCKTAYSEKKAEEYLNGMLRTPIILSNRMAPGIKRQIYLITAAYMNMTGWSQDLFPQTDIRYYLDMQMNMIANDPVFRDLGGFGIYCINRTESETTRWIFRLFRHYFVEGNREMLSKKYGFRFFPGHLQNTDFFHQGKYWSAESAEKNSIVFTRSLAFEKLQNRSGSDSHCCIMTRSAKAPNKLYQTARGLVPGKTYSFKVFAADLDAVETTAFQPGKLTFKVDLEGADIDRRRSYVFYPQKKNADNRVNINVIKIIFKATAPTMKICFSDWQNSTTPGGRIGQRLAFNFIQLRAFFEEETL